MAKILLIDDDPVYTDMTRQRLERAGHQVRVQLGPFGATATVRDNDFDLIVLDVFMPGLAGPDLLSIMRKSSAGARARVLLCSSMDAGPLAQLARERGADASISKSASRAEFIQRVDQLVETRPQP